jgi:hypothetical protein
MGGAGDEGVAAGAMDADFAVMGMNGCFHDSFLDPRLKDLILPEW